MFFDESKQKIAVDIRSEHIKDRNIDELIGLAKGVLADGVVAQGEVEYMISWIESHFNKQSINEYPLNIIYERLLNVMKDGVLDDDEAEEIKELLTMFTGGKPISEQVSDMSSNLPLCNPQPDIIFENKSFCFTGAFTIGTRTECEAIIKARGATADKNVKNSTDYLVVGIIGSGAWIHSSYGRKIEKAVNVREKCGNLSIISEEHLIKFI